MPISCVHWILGKNLLILRYGFCGSDFTNPNLHPPTFTAQLPLNRSLTAVNLPPQFILAKKVKSNCEYTLPRTAHSRHTYITIRLKKTIYSAQVTDLLRVMNKSLSVALVRNPTYTPASSPASRESVRDGPTHTHKTTSSSSTTFHLQR